MDRVTNLSLSSCGGPCNEKEASKRRSKRRGFPVLSPPILCDLWIHHLPIPVEDSPSYPVVPRRSTVETRGGREEGNERAWRRAPEHVKARHDAFAAAFERDMTVAVVCVGPEAGRAAVEALAHVEKVGHGAIGGFAHLAAVVQDDDGDGDGRRKKGRVVRLETQRHGSVSLLGSAAPKDVQDVLQAHVAALISSGPDRPTPLSQFVAADESGCVATGHRMPQALGARGKSLVEDALERMRSGATSEEAVQRVMAENPHADAGLVGADEMGNVFGENSKRVMRRPDVGHARRKQGNVTVEVLANSIGPEGQAIADLAAATAMNVMSPNKPNSSLWLVMGTPVEFDVEDTIVVEEVDGLAYISCVKSTDPLTQYGDREEVALIGPQTEVVWADGTSMGQCHSEPFMVIDKGRVVSCDGQEFYEVRYRGSQPCRPADPDQIFALTHGHPASKQIWRSPSASDFCFPKANEQEMGPSNMDKAVEALHG